MKIETGTDLGESIKKLSPLEQAIAEKKDRRRRWDSRLEKGGLKRTSCIVPERGQDALREFLLVWRTGKGDLDKALANLRNAAMQP